MYDIIVLGGGIAGASISYFATLNNKKVLLLDKGLIKDNASVAAGAFLSPKFGPKSSYNDFINRAFVYSIEFYRKNFSKYLDTCGMLRLPRDDEESLTCKNYAINSQFWKEFNFDNKTGYFCKDAASINPLSTIYKMLENCDFKENVGEVLFTCKNEIWQVNEFKAKHLILATGSKVLLDEPYIKIKPIFGQKIEMKIEQGYDFHIHRKCSVSAFVDGKILIGATHIPSWRYKEDEKLFETHRQKLIDEAKSLIKKNMEVVKISSGFRSSTTDYFPIAGGILDFQKTLEKFPLIKHGVKYNEDELVYHKNLWIHAGHGARGFVLAPYTAKELYFQMFDKEKFTEKEIALSRQLIRFARKM